jgi:hypothetical protein
MTVGVVTLGSTKGKGLESALASAMNNPIPLDKNDKRPIKK